MLLIGCIIAAMFVVPQASRGEYTPSNYLTFNRHAIRCAYIWNIAYICILAIGFLTKKTSDASRVAVLILYFGGFFALLLERWLIVRFTRARAERGGVLSHRVFLVGHESEIRTFRARYEQSMLGMHIVGAFALRGGASVQGDLALAAATARFLRPDEVFIVVSWSNQKTIDLCIDVFRRVPATIHLGPSQILTRFAHAHISAGAVPTLGLVRPPLSALDTVLKRAVDIVGSTLGLILLAPPFALVALLIKLDSPGPVIFQQRRYGFNQEPFRIFKFRTMTTMEDGKHVLQATKNDVRVTRIGRVLRRYNIDELPQLINVLRGEMSLVGPRPHAFAHDQQFEQSIAAYARRHNMKPEITGWAQVNGLRGEINSDADLRRRIEHDLFYIDNYSIWLDLRCIALTLISKKAYRNAY